MQAANYIWLKINHLAKGSFFIPQNKLGPMILYSQICFFRIKQLPVPNRGKEDN